MPRYIAVLSLALVAAAAMDDVQLPQAPIVAAAPVLVPPTIDILPRPPVRQIPVAQEAEELAQLQMQQHQQQPSRQAQPEGCSLSGQVKLCVNHAAMQRATCASDDLDCQCTWASVTTTCFAPCIAEKESADGMHVAKGDQEAICSQAAKFGKIAKDKEKQKQDEKNNRGKKKKDETRTGAPKNIDDMNNAPEPTANAANEKPKENNADDTNAAPSQDDSASDQARNQGSARKNGSNASVKQASNLDNASAPASAVSGAVLCLGLVLSMAYAIPSLF
ncbi:hypothetical protein LPJ64_005073 [Coemansia asiatica]|uniref:Extracellular membrane protein CFEM domain-containing protein n=1 Tax=Coemansia asiatica TaxID=1052880 RepID=A0A9W7XF27_9FUNG|nr:hypothetical protein LPJ64_005073 [Coemansia asiatica]